MDFSFNEEQEAVRELATRIFGDRATPERSRELETGGGELFDRDLWADLAGAGLLGIALPETYGGAGLGFVEACIVVEAAARAAAYVPVIETVTVGAAAIAAHGSPALQGAVLPGVVAGTTVVTTALAEPGGLWASPSVVAEPAGDGWSLAGVKAFVPSLGLADMVLVPGRTGPDGVAVFAVATDAAGVTRLPQQTNTRRDEGVLELAGVTVGPDAVVGTVDDGAEVVEWLLLRATTALAVAQAGVTAAALELMAAYTKSREQFGKPIATFQAVGQRAADAYVDAEAIRLTAWQAAWRIGMDLPAADATAVAKFWAADGGQRVVHAAVHLHGGVGVDREYPLHRYFLAAKQIELTLGGATDQLRTLGRSLASTPV